ncbi:hypothetical protein CFOL_v3_13170, partial [Cephalotus follicularis]
NYGSLVNNSIDYLRESQSANQHSKSVVSQMEVRWRRPPAGWIKCNTDGAVSNKDFSRIGLVFRDENEKALLASALKQHGWMAPLVVEALAIWKVVTVARERNFARVIF